MVQGVPKKLIYFSAFFSMLTMVILQIAVWKAYQQYTILHEVEFPLLEKNALALRLRERNTSVIRHTVNSEKTDELQEYERIKDFQTKNLNEMQTMSSQIGFPIDKQLFETRQVFLNIEKKIIENVKKHSFGEAKKIYQSPAYLTSLESYEKNLHQITKQLGAHRTKKMQTQVNYLRFFIFGTFMSFVFTVLCWVQTFRFIRKMAQQRKSTERKLQDERALRIASEKLASLGEMAGGIAHEINNPLAILSAQVQLLQTQHQKKVLSDEKLTHAINRMHDVAIRISRIVKGLLAFSRNDPKQKYEKAKLSKIIEDTLSLCSEKIKYQGIALTVTGDQDLEVECHVIEIEQILLNLISNAISVLTEEKNPSIVIHCKDLSEFVEIQITDNGPGIPKDIRDKIWQPFFTTKEVGKGTGLGLSISRSFAESHGGTLTLLKDSLVTCFSLKLPKKNTNARREVS